MSPHLLKGIAIRPIAKQQTQPQTVFEQSTGNNDNTGLGLVFILQAEQNDHKEVGRHLAESGFGLLSGSVWSKGQLWES